MRDSSIRDATREDIPAMVEMGRRFYDETGFESLVEFDEGSFARTLEGLIETQIALVTDGGMAVAMVVPSYVNESVLGALELFFWVDPEKRGRGMNLLAALEARAKERGARTMAVVACADLKPIWKVYERMGYRRQETTYLRAL